MWRRSVVIQRASAAPADLAAARAWCRVDGTDFDAQISAANAAARAHVERRCGLKLALQTVEMRTDDWADLEHLPVAPISGIDAVDYVDSAGVASVLAASVYEERLFGEAPAIALVEGQSWPATLSGSLITVTALAGYGALELDAADISLAVLMLTAHFFDNPAATGAGGAQAIPYGVAELLAPYDAFVG